MRYFVLGLDIYFEVNREGLFSYRFKEGKLETRNYISENISILAEEVKDFEYAKQLQKRIFYFTKRFK